MTEAELSYFAAPGPTTDLSVFSTLLDELPSEPRALARIVRGLLLHEGLVARAGLRFPPERLADRNRVGAAAILARVLALDSAPLQSERPVQRRMIGYCYHFAVLHCALLRAKGIPARARCGFAAYLRDGAWIDHWVVEYWDGKAWALIDLDGGRDSVSRDEFRDAGIAWTLCRKGDADPSLHGNYELWGWDELRGSLINDLGTLNRVEVGEWSWCKLIQTEHIDRPHAVLDARMDALAELLSDDASFEARARAYQLGAELQPPDELFAR